MAISEQQQQKLAEKIEDIIQSTNFGNLLGTLDAYVYEQMVIDAFEQNDMPQDIEPEDVSHELTLTNKKSSEAWAELLSREDIHNSVELEEYLDKEEDLAQLMLEHLEGNFDAEVEIKEELSEIRERKPDMKTLSDALELAYQESEFIEYLKENETNKLNEQIRESAADEGIPHDTSVDEIPYTLYVSLKTDFDTLAEKYLEEAKESGSTSMYAQENVDRILLQNEAYELDVEVDKEQFEEA
ncbi:TPA: hypothetical protein PD793_002657 [Staphylococcus aureus]|nr:hypothetical protein [Staphylococcus aureus]HDE9964312.1 hypothetical protein [Staphylococcus aureus]